MQEQALQVQKLQDATLAATQEVMSSCHPCATYCKSFAWSHHGSSTEASESLPSLKHSLVGVTCLGSLNQTSKAETENGQHSIVVYSLDMHLKDALLQARSAKTHAAELEQQLLDSESTAAGRIEELEGIVTVLNAQLDEASSHTDTSDQESSFYSHFDGRAIFGGSSFWMHEPVASAVSTSEATKPTDVQLNFAAPRFGVFDHWGSA